MIDIQKRAAALQLNRILLTAIAALPFLLGYLCGFVVKLLKLFAAAFVVGFERGANLGTSK